MFAPLLTAFVPQNNSSLQGFEEAALDLTSATCFHEKRAILAAVVSLVAFAAIGLGLSHAVSSASLIHYGIPTAVVLTAGLTTYAGLDKKALEIKELKIQNPKKNSPGDVEDYEGL